MARWRRRGAGHRGTARRQRAFRHDAAGSLCAAALRGRPDRAPTYRAEAKPVTRAGKEAARSRIAPQPWMEEPATQAVLAALNEAGIAARFVGGCVRDAILGGPIADID